ncbi:bifunctional aminoglycoside phosphotransferase/ATP-binding protein [Bradyrhizobium liaoningense]|uniref:bifunctional aminoglycoside phosphotransferase/ATP-binding protein n=1 Tax=Bradyrhizobium liaoningense TaxID=43992 RepID=UPI001BAB0FC5|nr:bifunctional aminoglycoside phosphotransferase/ATP-binding protein [Bradyrhizobium liaoningense]MBR0712989.1 AAA family ATPase [Bradyrhizobium liaoningense]
MPVTSTDTTAAQERVFAFLTHGDTTRIDTHAASVFLEGKRALKIKRAVRFPFLDYSTLDKRKAACEEEIRINRPLAPQIYHRVVAITEDRDGSLSIGGGGTPVEYAVEMSRFDESKTLDHIAKAGPLPDGLAAEMADAIAASHAIAPRVERPWVTAIPSLIDGNSAGLRIGGHLAANAIEALAAASHQALARIRSTLAARGRQGFVRRCHGDLHLANIVMIDERPVLFDAIEFDPDIASVDVLYDLAFAVMDLLRYGQQQAASILFNRYLATTPADHLDGLGALPLFLSIRAAIRAQVALARLKRPHVDQAEIVADAQHYFNLARALIDPPAPRLIAVGGLSGTGKSLLARMLAPAVGPAPGAVVLRTDTLRKHLFGVKDTDRLPSSAYQPEVTERVYETLAERARHVLAQGHSALIDAVFAQEPERDAMTALARACNVPLRGFFLVADLATRQARIGRRRNDASDATPEVAALQEHYNIGNVGWDTIDASGTPEQTLARCKAVIAGERPSDWRG